MDLIKVKLMIRNLQVQYYRISRLKTTEVQLITKLQI